MDSALWYGQILLSGTVTAVVAAILLIVLKILKHKMKE